VVADQSSRELIETLSFEAADPSDLKLAHDAAYVRDVLDGVRTNGHGNCRLEVADSTLWTVGSMIAAARDALQSRIAFSPSSGFHHAGFDWNHGFCTFNGLVVAARKLLIEGKVTKVGLLDCDWHLGDGTEAIIQRLGLQAQLLHFTSGASHFADTDGYFAWLRQSLRKLVSAKVGIVLYQAGADAHIDDPLGGLLSNRDLSRRDRRVFKVLASNQIPVAWNLAGGYQRDRSGSIEPVLAIHRNTTRRAIQTLNEQPAATR
jgi:acetoin utilization deacetylase AcuC-like enzyme